MTPETKAKLRNADYYALSIGPKRCIDNPRWRHHALSAATPYGHDIVITEGGSVECVVAVVDGEPLIAYRFYRTLAPGERISHRLFAVGTGA